MVSKERLRLKYKKIRNQIVIDDSMIKGFANHLCQVLRRSGLVDSDVVRIGIYQPLAGEVPIDRVFDELETIDKNLFDRLELYVPKVIPSSADLENSTRTDKEMVFVNVVTGDRVVVPEIIISPMVAFDDNLNRLGYGGGFYDHYIAKHRKNIKLVIGIALSIQKSDKCFAECFDVPMDVILTEVGTV